MTDGTWYNDPTLRYLSYSRLLLLSFPTLTFVHLFAVSLSPLSVSRIFSVRLPTAKATLGRNPNSVAKRLRRIAPTPIICISFVLEREIFCAPCFIESVRWGEAPKRLFPFRNDPGFCYGKRLCQVPRYQSSLTLN